MFGFAADNKQICVPSLMDCPQQVDFLTDEESDEPTVFKMTLPTLSSLLQEFENGDEAITKDNEEKNKFVTALKAAN